MNLWINGEYISEEDAKISPFDHGNLYGFNFLEKFRTYKGNVVLFQEHYHRFVMKLNQYHIEMPYSIKKVDQVIKEFTRYAKDRDGIFLLNVSVTTNNSESQFRTIYNKPTVVVCRKELPLKKSVIVKSAKWVTAQGEYLNYANKYTACLDLGNLDKTEGFILTQSGLIAEGITSSIFWAKEGTIFTPSINNGIEQSVTRQWVINTAKQMGFRVIEDYFVKRELEQAYECFIANSIDGIVPISNIEKVKFLGNDGSIYQHLAQAYIEEIIRTVKNGV